MQEEMENAALIFAPESTTTRVHTVSTKLNVNELEAFNQMAERRSVSPGELLRVLFREELERNDAAGAASKELVEIVGVRILLLTLLKPLLTGKTLMPEAIEKINTTARQMKKELAAAIAAGEQD